MTVTTVPEIYRGRLDKAYHVFSAAHFITLGGNARDRPHGHNYRAMAEVEGPVDESHSMVDFITLRDALKAVTDPPDHFMLQPTEHPTIKA